MRLLLITGLVLIAMAGLPPSARPQPAAADAPDLALTDDQCVILWKRAQGTLGDVGGATEISLDAAKPFVKDTARADADADGKLTTKEWADACTAGLIMSAPVVAPEPLPQAPEPRG